MRCGSKTTAWRRRQGSQTTIVLLCHKPSPYQTVFLNLEQTGLHLADVNGEVTIKQEEICLQIAGVGNVHHDGMLSHHCDSFCLHQMSFVSQSAQLSQFDLQQHVAGSTEDLC